MHFLQLTLLYCLLNVFDGDQASEYSSLSETKVVEPTKETEATNIVLQSNDGGKTWQDISSGLPENWEGNDYFANDDGLFVTAGDQIYHTKPNSKGPFWNKESFPNKESSIAPGKSGMYAFNWDGQLLYKANGTKVWETLPTGSNIYNVRTILETAGGTILIGCDYGLYKSTNKGRSWKKVFDDGLMELVESEGVIIGAGGNGILRSADNGEHWEWVISEGGMGKVVARIDGGFAAISVNPRPGISRVRTSMDGGKTWSAIDAGLTPTLYILSIAQMGSDLFVGHQLGIYRSPDKGKTWFRVHTGFGTPRYTMNSESLLIPAPDPIEKMYKLYVSGNVLYAVAGYPGC